MKMTNLVSGSLFALMAAVPALADCPGGSLPTQLQVSNWSASSPVGSSRVAADDGIIVTEHRVATGNDVLIFRPSASGWALDRSIFLASTDGPFAVSGDIIAVSSQVTTNGTATGTLKIFKRDSVTGEWSNTSTVSAPGVVTSVVAGPSTLVAVWSSFITPLFTAAYTVRPDGTLQNRSGPTDPSPDAGNDGFGISMSLDGDMLAVGAFADNEAGQYVGAAYIYRRVSNAWMLVQKIMPDAATASPGFGISVALNGGHLAVGSVHASRVIGDVSSVSFANGFVNVYEWNGTSFVLNAHLTHPRLPSSTPAAFGTSVAIRGTRVLVGAYQDRYSGLDSGAGYVFDFDGSTWRSTGAIALPSSAGAWLGSSVAFAGTSAVAVAPFHDQGHLAAAVFDACSLPDPTSSTPQCLPGIGGLMSYLLRWFQSDPWADFDQNGTVTVADLMAFLTAWFAGC